MRWPFAPSRSRARATTACTSALPALTADSSSNAAPVTDAIRRATVVLPVPGGPYRITEPSRSSSIVRRSGAPGPSRCSWPATSSRVRGRRRSASGAPDARARPAASAKRSSTPPMLARTCTPTMCRMDGALREEATKLLADLIRIDTSNPPGHETPAAVFLQWFLEREGISLRADREGPGPRQPRRAHQGQRRGAVPHVARAHGRRAGRARVLERRSLRGRGAGRLRLGSRRARHEEPHGLQRPRLRADRAQRHPSARRSGADRRGRRGGGHDRRRAPVRRRAAPRRAHRLRAQRVERAHGARRRPRRAPLLHG